MCHLPGGEDVIEHLRTVLRVLLRDAAGIGVYWVIACALGRLADAGSAGLAMGLTFLLWLLLAGVLFFSHGELLRWMKNDKAWAVATGLLTVAVMLPVVMISLDNPCPWSTINYGSGG